MEISREQLLKRIDERVKELGISLDAASKTAKLERTFLSQIMRSKTRWPRMDTLQRICDAIGIRVYWVTTGLGPRLIEDQDLSADVASVPLVSWVAASSLIEVAEIEDRFDLPHILVPEIGRGDYIALKVVGDSMNIVAPEGSYIVVNRTEKELVQKGFYVVASEDGGEATFKQWRTRPGRFTPYSTNPEHEPIYQTKSLIVIGRVRKVLLDL